MPIEEETEHWGKFRNMTNHSFLKSVFLGALNHFEPNPTKIQFLIPVDSTVITLGTWHLTFLPISQKE